MSNILHHITDKVIEIVMAKITDEHPFWQALRLLLAIVIGAWAIRAVLLAFDSEVYTKDAGLAYGLVLLWFGVCHWALPNILDGFNGRKLFWQGWVVAVAVATIVNIVRIVSGNWEPLIP